MYIIIQNKFSQYVLICDIQRMTKEINIMFKVLLKYSINVPKKWFSL